MITLDFSLDSSKNGGNVTAFSYSHSLNELVGSWSASVAGGSFKAGDSISFSGVMKDGIITGAYKDSDGLWHVEGRDAGVNLMKSTPDIADLPEGNAKTVIQSIADFCEITLSMTVNGLTGFNVRSLISGSTCAEAVLELAMFSGLIAYINRNGVLVVAEGRKYNPTFEHVIDDSGSSIDLDGYATQTLINLNRRKWPDNSDDDEEEGEIVYSGETPSTQPKNSTVSGSFTNGDYSITTLEPFGVLKRASTVITDNGVTITTIEEHDYSHKHKVIWRDNQEYVLFAFIETGYALTRTAEGQYSTDKGETLAFKEITTETMTRNLSLSDQTIGVPEDWQGDIDMVDSETITRSTVREGGKTPTADMPAYSPPFDSQITRTYTREKGGKGLLCTETELTYEARQIGSIAPVKSGGSLVPHFMRGSNLAIQTHSTPQWVLVRNRRTYYEQYSGDGECLFSARSEYSDDGAEWLAANALSSTGDSDLDDYQKAYAKFSQNSQGLQVSLGSSVLNSAWQFIELQGRMKSTVTDSDKTSAALGNVSDWYDNGAYVRTSVCPHYNSSSKTCNVYLLDNPSNTACSHYKGMVQWMYCSRALAALELARLEDSSQVEVPIIGMASVKSSVVKNPDAGYQRDVYIDELLTDTQAQSIADTIAENVLTVKSIKGFRKTVTVPYNTDFHPDGTIVEVSHDWQNLQTSVTYRDSGDIPDCLISQSVAGIASFVAMRENSRLNVPRYGAVVSCSGGTALVKVGNSDVRCTTKLRNLAQGDIVLVSFPAGNKLRGQVIARL